MKSPPLSYRYSWQQGFSLLEVLIAILIFSVGILGLVGLQASMLKASAEARYRAQATYIAQQRIGTIWINQDEGHLAGFAEDEPGTDIEATTGLPGGRRVTIRGGDECDDDLSCFFVRVSWQQPGGAERHAVMLTTHATGG